MSILEKATERASQHELAAVDELARLFQECPLTLQEKLVNPGLFIRRQELSYIIANYEIFKLVREVKGSIFYFGVYHGAGFMAFANLSAALEPFNHTREIVGFDTFAGYPKISEKDVTDGKDFRTLQVGGFFSDSKQFLEKRIDLYDGNRPLSHIAKAKLIQGDVCETLPDYLRKNRHIVVSLMVLTMNLYEATKTSLSLIWPRMPKGGVCVVHSLNEEYCPGAADAVFDVLGSNISVNTFGYAPNLSYIIKQ